MSEGKEKEKENGNGNGNGKFDLRKMYFRILGLPFLYGDTLHACFPCNKSPYNILNKLHYGTTAYVALDTAMQMKKAYDKNNSAPASEMSKNLLFAGSKSVIWHIIATFAFPTFFYNQIAGGSDYMLHNLRIPNSMARNLAPKIVGLGLVTALITSTDQFATQIVDTIFPEEKSENIDDKK